MKCPSEILLTEALTEATIAAFEEELIKKDEKERSATAPLAAQTEQKERAAHKTGAEGRIPYADGATVERYHIPLHRWLIAALLAALLTAICFTTASADPGAPAFAVQRVCSPERVSLVFENPCGPHALETIYAVTEVPDGFEPEYSATEGGYAIWRNADGISLSFSQSTHYCTMGYHQNFSKWEERAFGDLTVEICEIDGAFVCFWYDNDYVYQIFCRRSLTDKELGRMLESLHTLQ